MTDPTSDPTRVFNVKAVITVLFCVAYIGVMVWAVVHDKIDLPSFISGLGPSVGALIKGWFDSKA